MTTDEGRDRRISSSLRGGWLAAIRVLCAAGCADLLAAARSVVHGGVGGAMKGSRRVVERIPGQKRKSQPERARSNVQPLGASYSVRGLFD